VIGGELAAASDVRDARWVTSDDLPAMTLTDGLLTLLERGRAAHRTWR
jgi:hypothetical protein